MEILQGDLIDGIVRGLDGTAIGFDDRQVSVFQHARLRERVPGGAELVPAGGLVEALRRVKDADELARIRAAAELIDGLYAWVLDHGLGGRTEIEVAVALEHEMRVRGAQGPSFASIVASGAHGALPHATPRDEPIADGTFVTIDMGALLNGYCSDCTRTFAVGREPDEEAAYIYEIVLRSQLAGVSAVAPGPTGEEVDAFARTVIDAAGFGENFGHGLGHGVGVEIHEGPRLSRQGAEDPLVAGNVVTVEPGIYLPGRLGVRIEDLLFVTDTGHEVVSRFTKQLLVVD
jgi:Xaa-Pro aminopeptidase